jgi:hypothetical protein
MNAPLGWYSAQGKPVSLSIYYDPSPALANSKENELILPSAEAITYVNSWAAKLSNPPERENLRRLNHTIQIRNRPTTACNLSASCFANSKGISVQAQTSLSFLHLKCLCRTNSAVKRVPRVPALSAGHTEFKLLHRLLRRPN